jgi:hypothetical protein
MTDTIGDEPLEPRFAAQMNAFAGALDKILNDEARGEDRNVGFVLMVFPIHGYDGRCNYVSNVCAASRRSHMAHLSPLFSSTCHPGVDMSQPVFTAIGATPRRLSTTNWSIEARNSTTA